MRSIKRTEYIYHIKSLLLLGLPIIIGQLGNIITGLADTVMVGQHSTEELAAASFVNNVINAFIILGTGFSFNYTPIIGENIAVNKRIAIGGWLKNSLMANFTTTISILIVLLLIYTNIELLKQPDELMPLIKPYYIVLMCSVLFVMLANSFRQFVEGIMDASISMWILTIGNAMNIAGNYILIYGKFGLRTRTFGGRYQYTSLTNYNVVTFYCSICETEKISAIQKRIPGNSFQKSILEKIEPYWMVYRVPAGNRSCNILYHNNHDRMVRWNGTCRTPSRYCYFYGKFYNLSGIRFSRCHSYKYV